MCQLDLTTHDPDEYTGKRVIWNGVSYVVGPHVDSGLSKIVHKLINERSGLCLHVIKIWRNKEEAHNYESLIIRPTTEFGITPETHQLFAHGGAFLIQKHLKPHEDHNSYTGSLMANAEELIRKQQFSEAINLYNRILTQNPNHTEALTSKAHTLLRLKSGSSLKPEELQAVFKAVSLAYEVEPNYLSYFRNCMRVALECGYIRYCRVWFEQARTRLILTSQDYKLGILAFLESGNPERAKELLELCNQQTKRTPKGLVTTVEEAMKQKRTATELVSRTRRGEDSGDGSDSVLLSILEKASEIYSKDIQTQMNLVFTLSRCGRFEDASGILYKLINVVPTALLKTCFANLGFCEFHCHNVVQASRLFDNVAKLLMVEKRPEAQTDPWDLPRVGVWVTGDGFVLQEPPISAVMILDKMLRECRRQEISVPEEIEELYAEYKRAAMEYERANAE